MFAKHTITKMKRQLIEWGKICKYTSDKVLIARIYNTTQKLKMKKLKQAINKCADELNRQF